MRSVAMLAILSALCPCEALPPARLPGRAVFLRSALAAAGAAALRPASALQNQGAIGATCGGFGCNDYRGQSFNGMPAAGSDAIVAPMTGQAIDPAPANSMPYDDFLQAIKEQRVLGVDFIAPNGDEAYALIKEGSGGKKCNDYDPDAAVVGDVCRLRMGEGWPVEVSNSWSSPAWVMRILENEKIPYELKIDLKKKRKYY